MLEDGPIFSLPYELDRYAILRSIDHFIHTMPFVLGIALALLGIWLVCQRETYRQRSARLVPEASLLSAGCCLILRSLVDHGLAR